MLTHLKEKLQFVQADYPHPYSDLPSPCFPTLLISTCSIRILINLTIRLITFRQVLTHLKEKLQFVQADNHLLKHDLTDLEVELTNKRDVLTQVQTLIDIHTT